jgi:hypothetical protein
MSKHQIGDIVTDTDGTKYEVCTGIGCDRCSCKDNVNAREDNTFRYTALKIKQKHLYRDMKTVRDNLNAMLND